MKQILLRAIIAMGISFLNGIILTCLFTGVLLANEGKAQHKNVKEVLMPLDLENATLKQTIDVVWEEVPARLQKVVVSTGYWGTEEKVNPGNISPVAAIEIEKQPVANSSDKKIKDNTQDERPNPKQGHFFIWGRVLSVLADVATILVLLMSIFKKLKPVSKDPILVLGKVCTKRKKSVKNAIVSSKHVIGDSVITTSDGAFEFYAHSNIGGRIRIYVVAKGFKPWNGYFSLSQAIVIYLEKL